MRLNYISLADDTGYAVAGRRYIELLRAAGVEVRALSMVPGSSLGLGYECGHGSLYPDAPTIFHTVPEYYPHLTRRLKTDANSAPRIGMTVWETTRLPRHWPALLNSLDALIVPTEWNRRVFSNAGVTIPIHVLPHASEFEGYLPEQKDIDALKSKLPALHGKFVFYNIGTWMKRKGIDKLIHAFLEAFAGRTDVILILKTSGSDHDRHGSKWRRLFAARSCGTDWRRRARQSVAPSVVLLTDSLSREEMQALHHLSDCFVSLARGEGWGLGSYEAAFFGKPLILTGFGGHMDFAPEDLASHVAYRLVQVAVPDNASYTADQMWAEPDLKDAIRAMQCAISEPSAAFNRAARLKRLIKLRFSAEAITLRFLKILGQITQARTAP